MSVKEFTEKVRKAVQEVLGNEYFVEAVENEKLNGIKYHGISIHSKDKNVTPVIYMENFCKRYEEGRTLGDIVNEIVKLYWEYAPKESIDLEFINDFESVKDKICMKLCNRERNSSYLEELAHIDFLDLAIIFYMVVDECPNGIGTITLRNDLIEGWNVKTSDLMALAMENTVRTQPVLKKSMNEFLREYIKRNNLQNNMAFQDMFGEADRMLTACPELWILTNKSMSYGAAAILYPKELESFADEHGSSLYIIPSSVHEVILLPDNADIYADLPREERISSIKEMIAQVNDTELPKEDFLSYSLYYYDREEKRVSVV
ncbi:MAG: hypothetical protein IJ796_06250 [Lachnospiraceae bacterium]|nr:hypothetical protein [Lachnospiraceae bacterium]